MSVTPLGLPATRIARNASVRRTILLALTLCAAQSWAAACRQVVISADPDYPPLHWYDGQSFHGASIAMATQVLRQMGVPYEVRYVGPFSRALYLAGKGEIDMITTLKITRERSRVLAFAAQPGFANPIAVFVPVARAFPYRRWSDLRGKHGGITRGNRFGEPFDTYAAQALDLQDASTLQQNFKKLQYGRIDYFLTGYYTGMAAVEQQRLQDQIQVLKPFVISRDNYVAFSKASPCAALLPAYNRAMAVWRQQHTPQELLDAARREWSASLDLPSASRPAAK